MLRQFFADSSFLRISSISALPSAICWASDWRAREVFWETRLTVISGEQAVPGPPISGGRVSRTRTRKRTTAALPKFLPAKRTIVSPDHLTPPVRAVSRVSTSSHAPAPGHISSTVPASPKSSWISKASGISPKAGSFISSVSGWIRRTVGGVSLTREMDAVSRRLENPFESQT